MPYFGYKKRSGARKIARIDGGKLDGNYIYLYEDDKDFDSGSEDEEIKELINSYMNRGLRELKVDKDSTLQYIPYVENEYRETIFIFGAEGSGKSHFAANYGKEYKKIFKKNNIYVFSKVDEDKNIDKLKPIRIKLDNEIVDDPIQVSELRDSLCIFDDVEKLKSKDVINAIQKLKDELLETGRHDNVYVLALSHNPVQNKITKTNLSDTKALVMFPNSGDDMHIDYILTKYVGVRHADIREKIMKLKSRWVFVNKRAPKYVLYEHGIFFL